MSLPLGAWNMNANGIKPMLSIKGIDAAGKLDITLQGVSVVGYWDEESRRILFQGPSDHERTPGGELTETYVGYLLDLTREKSTMAQTLAGYFENECTSKPRQRNALQKRTYGWYAQLLTPPITLVNIKEGRHRSTSKMTTSTLA